MSERRAMVDTAAPATTSGAADADPALGPAATSSTARADTVFAAATAAGAGEQEARVLRKQGNGLLQVNQPQAALDCFDRALACDPADAFTLNDRGNALQDLQRLPEAVASYDRALQIKPAFAAALTNRGNVLRALKRLDEALLSLDAALSVRPAFPEALNNRGTVLREMGRLGEALVSFDEALALKPEFVMAQCNRGNTLLDLGRLSEALDCFEATLRPLPDDPEALFGRASALLQLRQNLEEAVADFDRAAELGVDRTEVLVGKAAALAELQRHGEAAACLSEVLAIAPEREYAHGSLMYSRLQTCDWTDFPAFVAELDRLVREGRRVTHPLSLLPLVDSPELHLACAQVLAGDKYVEDLSLGPCAPRLSRAEDGAESTPHLAMPRRSTPVERFPRKTRVAYVSADFRDHPVSHLLVGVLERHDRERVEMIGVSLRAGEGGELEQRVQGAFDRFVDVTGHSDRAAAALLRELEVDIAVDLMGFTQGLRLGIFAHRAAPVQVSYLGYAGTLGVPYMDYLLADEIVVPYGEERWYSEQVVRLPHCYLPNDDGREIAARPTRAQVGLPADALVFCAFTNAYKINPPVFEIWMRLLQEVPGSVLWLREIGAEGQSNLLREAQLRGVDARRLVFAPRVASMAEHLARQGLADLYLDTLPYNAHSTACDALWSGVPILTRVGRSFASRAAASALTAAGLAELITDSPEEYERKALELALHPEQLQAVRAKLSRRRTGSALFDTTRYCRHLESAYDAMHQRSLRGEPAQGFRVEPLPA
jgi:protein O-GlcNAc transferase